VKKTIKNIGVIDSSSLDTGETGRYVGVSEAALRLWRAQGKGPPYYLAGEKLVRYRRTDLDAWIQSRLVVPSSK